MPGRRNSKSKNWEERGSLGPPSALLKGTGRSQIGRRRRPIRRPPASFRGFGTSHCCHCRVRPEKPREGEGGQGQLGPGPRGAASVVEANQVHCLDLLTLLGPSIPARTPREKEGGLGPPALASSNANTAAHSTGRRNRAKAQETQLASGSAGAGRSSRRRAPTGPGPAVLLARPCGSKDTQSGLLAPQVLSP